MLARTDPDTVETGEWLDSLRAVLHYQGAERAAFLLETLTDEAQRAGISTSLTLNTPYVNTIPPEREERANWDRAKTPSGTTAEKSRAGSNVRFGCNSGLIVCAEEFTRMVYPSGSDLATKAVPIVVPAPPRFSTTTG